MQQTEERTVKRWSIRMPDDLATAAELLASVQGVSVNQLVIELVETKVAQVREEPATLRQIEEQVSRMREQYGLG